jgi:hypothetical protein
MVEAWCVLNFAMTGGSFVEVVDFGYENIVPRDRESGRG